MTKLLFPTLKRSRGFRRSIRLIAQARGKLRVNTAAKAKNDLVEIFFGGRAPAAAAQFLIVCGHYRLQREVPFANENGARYEPVDRIQKRNRSGLQLECAHIHG